ncbi:MAG TPA: NUDIX hydrolase, partial [Thermoanaerobaculia bacterium]|nr:NUDIX hydrolase [Thermoanaerobaculia bacterium]
MAKDPEVLCEGRHMLFVRRDGWEYVEHRTAKEAAMIVAVTARGEIVLAEEFRPPMNAPVVSLPAGLVGDEGPEDPSDAARRELAEETGHAAERLVRLGRGPGSAGQSSEMVTFFLAEPAERVGDQAPHDRGRIRVHVVPVDRLPDWAARREAEGAVIDPKIWAGLYLAGRRKEGLTPST